MKTNEEADRYTNLPTNACRRMHANEWRPWPWQQRRYKKKNPITNEEESDEILYKKGSTTCQRTVTLKKPTKRHHYLQSLTSAELSSDYQAYKTTNPSDTTRLLSSLVSSPSRQRFKLSMPFDFHKLLIWRIKCRNQTPATRNSKKYTQTFPSLIAFNPNTFALPSTLKYSFAPSTI